MSEKTLLLSSAKMAVIVRNEPWKKWVELSFWKEGWHRFVLVVWILLVLIGLGNILVRLSHVHLSLSVLSPHSLAVGPGFAFPSLDYSASTTSSFVPAHIAISSIGVDAQVEQVGIAPDGSMANPSSFKTVGFYKDGSHPGEEGNAVFDGHVNNALTSAGVFEHLDAIHLGDTIVLSDAQGNTRTYTVSGEQLYAADSAPLSEIFSRTGSSQVVLITCDGAWDKGKKEFDKRLVVYASLVQ